MKLLPYYFTICIFSILAICGSESLYSQEDYPSLLSEITLKQQEIKQAYQSATTQKKDSLITLSRAYLLDKINAEIFPFWYGTPWGFNGTTRTPREGKIACGYFVTTILSDIGFTIPRIRWAQSASAVFINKLAQPDIKRYSNASILKIKEILQDWGDGLYLVGLDNHTGFIRVRQNEIKFIHASYYQPEIGVLSEPVASDNPLANSRYRIFGKLLSDDMIIHWIEEISY